MRKYIYASYILWVLGAVILGIVSKNYYALLMTYKESLIDALGLAVREVFGNNLEYYLTPCRKREIADVRMMSFLLLRQKGMSFQEIGRTLGKHHTSVIYGVRQAEAHIQYDKRFRHDYTQLKKAFQKFIAQ